MIQYRRHCNLNHGIRKGKTLAISVKPSSATAQKTLQPIKHLGTAMVRLIISVKLSFGTTQTTLQSETRDPRTARLRPSPSNHHRVQRRRQNNSTLGTSKGQSAKPSSGTAQKTLQPNTSLRLTNPVMPSSGTAQKRSSSTKDSLEET